MGIPSYFKNIIDTYRHSMYKHVGDIRVGRLYFDANSIIYDCLREHLAGVGDVTEELYRIKQDYTILLDLTRDAIDEYIRRVAPSDFVFVSFDGVVPLAKMRQQRERRFKGVIAAELEKQIAAATEKPSGAKPSPGARYDPDQLFSTVEITPGTPFMNALNEYFRGMELPAAAELGARLVWSLTDEPGEGEHKICAHLRENPDPEASAAIYGLDADLFVLSLQHLRFAGNVYLVREQPEYVTALHDVYSQGEYVCVHINALAEQIVEEMGGASDADSDARESCIHDYVFLTFFAGNDFLPHLFGLSLRRCGFTLLLEQYKLLQKGKCTRLVTRGEISWPAVKRFLGQLARQETKLVRDEYKWLKQNGARKLRHWTSNTPEEKVLFSPHLMRENEDFVAVHASNWDRRYYDICFHGTPYAPRPAEGDRGERRRARERREEDIRHMCWNYFQGLEWVLKYYTGKGEAADIVWSYKHTHAPLLSSLAKHAPAYNMGMFSEQNRMPLEYFHPDLQLCYVLPPKYHHMIPECSRGKLYKLYPVARTARGTVDCFLCMYFWEGALVCYDINISELNAELHKS
jgi:5'-3' exonuclease